MGLRTSGSSPITEILSPSSQRCGGSCTWSLWSSPTSSTKYSKQDLKSVLPSLPLDGILECPGPLASYMPGSVDSDQLLTMHANAWSEKLEKQLQAKCFQSWSA